MTQAAVLALLPADNYAPDQGLARTRDCDLDFAALLEEMSADMDVNEGRRSESRGKVVDSDEIVDTSAPADETADDASTEPIETHGDDGDADNLSEQRGAPADKKQPDQSEESATTAAQEATAMMATANIVANPAAQDGTVSTSQANSNAPQDSGDPSSSAKNPGANVIYQQAGQSSESSVEAGSGPIAEKPVLPDTPANAAEQAPSRVEVVVAETTSNTAPESSQGRDGDSAVTESNKIAQNIATTYDVAGDTADSSLSSTPQQRQGNLFKHSLGSNSGNGAIAATGAEKLETVNSIVGTAGPEAPSAADMAENVERIVKAARAAISRGSARIEIRLEPPELGSLRIEIKQNAQGLTLELQAGNVRAQQLLQRNIGQLHQMLEANGLPTNQINVELRTELQDGQLLEQEQGADTFSEQSSDDDTAGQDSQQQDFQSEYYAAADIEGNESQKESTESVLAGAEGSDSWRELDFAAIDVTV